MYKKFTLKVVISTVSLLLCFALVIAVFDPYFHYHAPWFGLKPVVTSERYQNPGMAEHFVYDSILIGSSMTENFRASWFDKAFECHTIKLSYSGARTKNFRLILDKTVNERAVKNVFWGLDMDPLFNSYDTLKFPLPEYLYDKDPWNDTDYLLNKSVLLSPVKDLLVDNLKNQVPSMDDSYLWENMYTFSKQSLLDSINWDVSRPNGGKVDASQYLENCKKNLSNDVLPYIAANPNTQFYIFFPPYSIAWWNLRIYKGDIDPIMTLLDTTITELLKYDNVKLYYFQDNKKIITNLDNYKDYSHYSPQINRFILSSIQNDQYRLTKENYKGKLNAIDTLAKNYDYSVLVNNKKS